jgi:hypothetical protein
MIEMQVRIDDVVNSAEFHARTLQPIEEIRVQVVPPRDRGALLAIPDTWINDDHLARDHDQERLHQSPQTTSFVDKVRCQPLRPRDIGKIKFGDKAL